MIMVLNSDKMRKIRIFKKQFKIHSTVSAIRKGDLGIYVIINLTSDD